MAYSEPLAERVRSYLASAPDSDVEEKKMMGGLTFMVNGKMCVGILKDDLMVRHEPELYESLLQKPGAKPLDFTGRITKGFLLVEPKVLKDEETLAYWLDLALDFNKKAKPSKKK